MHKTLMQKTSLAWLLLGAMGMMGLWSCGDSGGSMGPPPGSFSYGVNEGTHSSRNEPPGTDNEIPISATEGASCGMEERLYLSDLLLHFQVPLCEFEASCSDDIVAEPPTGGVDSTTTREATLHTLGLSGGGFGEIPSFCSSLAFERLPSGQDSSDCAMFEALGHVAKEYPACDQHVVSTKGICTATLRRCVGDMLAAGCADYLAERHPASCRKILPSSESQDSPEPEPMPGDPQPAGPNANP